MLGFLESYGLLGLFIGSFLAATILPFSSEILLSGLLITGASPVAAFIHATLGNWLGGLTSYWVGRVGSWAFIERWFGVKEESLQKQRERIEKYGAIIALFTWLPFIGDLLSIGLGFYRVDIIKCSVYMLIGRAIRFATIIFLFYFVGKIVF